MWYVILDQSGAVKQEHFETKAMLLEYLEASLRMKRIGDNQWARGGKRRVVLAAYKEWSDGLKLVGQISEMAGSLAGD